MGPVRLVLKPAGVVAQRTRDASSQLVQELVPIPLCLLPFLPPGASIIPSFISSCSRQEHSEEPRFTMAKTLTINAADIMSPFKFPEYNEPSIQSPTGIDRFEPSIMAKIEGSPVQKLVEEVSRTPGREPSPQPTHFSVPYKNGNGNGHRILRSATVGYIAPEFKGKQAQMLQGESSSLQGYVWYLVSHRDLYSMR